GRRFSGFFLRVSPQDSLRCPLCQKPASSDVESPSTKAYIFPSKSPGIHPPGRIPVQVEDRRAPAERNKGRYVLPSHIQCRLKRITLLATCRPAFARPQTRTRLPRLKFQPDAACTSNEYSPSTPALPGPKSSRSCHP